MLIALSDCTHLRIPMYTCLLFTCTVGGSRNDVLIQQHDDSQITRPNSGVNSNNNAASSSMNMMAWSANLTDSVKVSSSTNTAAAVSGYGTGAITNDTNNDTTVVPPQVEMMLEKYSDILMGMLERKMNN
jgi:hypothetical protein